MSTQFTLTAKLRTQCGTGVSRRLRRNGEVPAVLYGGQQENIIMRINHNLLIKSLGRDNFYSTIMIIDIEGKKEQAILRNVQRHPYKNSIQHADFQRVDDNQILIISLPIKFIGADMCVGAKAGGIISHLMSEVEICCLPKNLPNSIELDVSTLNLNESLHLSDIKLGDGVQLTALNQNDSYKKQAVVTVVQKSINDTIEDVETEVNSAIP